MMEEACVGSGHPEAAQNPSQRGREAEGGRPTSGAEAPSARAGSTSPSVFNYTAEIKAEIKNYKTVTFKH